MKVDDPEPSIYVDLAAEDSHPAVADTVIMVSKARDGAYVITTTAKSSKTADPAAPKVDSTTIRVVKFPPVGDPKSIVYVLDGKVVDTVEDLDPDQIKSISILKNPEAVAKYGERARDGVVVLTTKSSGTDGGKGVVTSESSKSE